MKQRIKLSVFFSIIFLFLSCSSNNKIEITLIHFNDFHSKITEFKVSRKDKNKSAGIARIVKLISDLKKQNPNSFVFMAGDMIQGSPFSTLKKGSVSFSLFNDVIDYLVLGNHEFDYGLNNLIHLINNAKFKTLNSNIFYKNSNMPFTKITHDYINVKGVKIAIFGLTTSDTPVTTLPQNVKMLRFEDEIKTAKKFVKIFKRNKSNVIIGLTHIGFFRDKVLAKKVKGIDILIGGHTHTKLKQGYMEGNTLITQARHNGEYIGVIKITLDTTSKRILNLKSRLVKVDSSIKKHKATAKRVAQIEKNVMAGLDKQIGKTQTALISTRKQESNLGNLIADVIKTRSKADLALVNSGGIRADIHKGPIKLFHVLKVLPFGNSISIATIKGSLLLNIFKKSALKKGSGAFMQVSNNVKYIIKNRILKGVTINGQKIMLNKIYRVATSNFIAAGGDGYTEFKNAGKIYDTGNLISTAVINFIKSKKSIAKKIYNRIIIK